MKWLQKYTQKYKLNRYTDELIALQCQASDLFAKRESWVQYPLIYNEKEKSYGIRWVNGAKSIRWIYKYREPSILLCDSTELPATVVERELRLNEIDILMRWLNGSLPAYLNMELKKLNDPELETKLKDHNLNKLSLNALIIAMDEAQNVK